MKTYKILFVSILTFSLLTGCKSTEELPGNINSTIEQDQGEQIVFATPELTPSSSPAPEASPNPDDKNTSDEPLPSSKPDRYLVAGITNATEFESFFGRLQERVSAGEKGRVAQYVDYPFSYYQGGFKKTVKNADKFVEVYDKIFTQKVIDAIVNQKIGNAFVRDGGVMIGEGEVWINASLRNDLHYAITSINN